MPKLKCKLACMIRLTHKSKQYLLLALKLLILAATFWYIFSKLKETDAATLDAFFHAFDKNPAELINYGFHFVILAFANWIFEILKWKTVVSFIEKISFKTALKQSLAALTVSLATPNRIGDYGAKAMYFEAPKRKQVLLLNFFANGAQLLVTIAFGLNGILSISQVYNLQISVLNTVLVLIVIVLFVFLGYLFKEREFLVRGLSFSKVFAFINRIKLHIKLKTLAFAVVRYCIFSFLFYVLLRFFGVTLPATEIAPLIFSMYLLVSIVPSMFIFDVVIRGGVAVWLFSLAGVSEISVLCAVLMMWLLNFVFPAIWGSYYVATFKNQKL